jgi:hypothetical protein
MEDVEKEIARRMQPYREDVDRLCTIPGVERVTAWGLLAEIGFNQEGQLSDGVLAIHTTCSSAEKNIANWDPTSSTTSAPTGCAVPW